MGFSFGEPAALLLLGAIPIAYYIYARGRKRKTEAVLRFSRVGAVKKAFSGKGKRRTDIIFSLLLLVLVLLSVGLADPHIPLKRAKEGVNVILVIDDSGSMKATDYKPTRLEAAKSAAETLIRSLQPKDYVGIIIFESGATTAAYLSPNKERVIEKLRAIRQRDGKTALGDGLSLAVDMAVSVPNKKRVIILLSDGVNNAGVISPLEAANYAKMNNIQVYTVGMGSKGRVILGYDWFGNPQYAELDEATLRKIAEITGGSYYKSVDENTLSEIYSRLGKNIKREWEDTSIKDWFVLSALIVLVFALYLAYGRYRVVI